MSGSYTDGWPKRVWTKDIPAASRLTEIEMVVPLSDAERMREALEEILNGDHYGDLTAIYEIARGALEDK